MLHQTAERRPVTVEVVLLQTVRFVLLDLKEISDELLHLEIDLCKKPTARRIKRVVQVENPRLDFPQRRWP